MALGIVALLSLGGGVGLHVLQPQLSPLCLIQKCEQKTKTTNNSQISVLFDNKWVKIPRAAFSNYWEENHPISRRKRIAFLVTEAKLNSFGVLTAKIDATVNQLGGNWINNAPDTWNGTAVTCFVNIQRRDGGGLNYIPCQL
ncbi:MAG TPA: hypothetical protein DCY88_14110 [Cyanobacteria bacterium UBA11372]|nr:hypothetical protein [Cyanobacteria bacterium UBA11372]